MGITGILILFFFLSIILGVIGLFRKTKKLILFGFGTTAITVLLFVGLIHLIGCM